MEKKRAGRHQGRGARPKRNVVVRGAVSKPLNESEQALDGEVLAPGKRHWQERAAEVRAALQECELHVRKTVEYWVKTGQLLIEAKREVEHGEWLPFLEAANVSVTKAERLMAVARHPTLSKSTRGPNLPPHWSTLFVLSKLEPKKLEQAIKDGKVHPEMDRADAEWLLKPDLPPHQPRLPAADGPPANLVNKDVPAEQGETTNLTADDVPKQPSNVHQLPVRRR